MGLAMGVIGGSSRLTLVSQPVLNFPRLYNHFGGGGLFSAL